MKKLIKTLINEENELVTPIVIVSDSLSDRQGYKLIFENSLKEVTDYFRTIKVPFVKFSSLFTVMQTKKSSRIYSELYKKGIKILKIGISETIEKEIKDLYNYQKLIEMINNYDSLYFDEYFENVKELPDVKERLLKFLKEKKDKTRERVNRIEINKIVKIVKGETKDEQI